jgi:hypothetical protein
MKRQTSIILLLLTFLLVNVDNATAQQKHEYVNLGLPSGTLWATCNVGADNPEDYGNYYAWGETEPKDTYSWSNYKYCKDGDYKMLTKYGEESPNKGFSYNTKDLDSSDDVATVCWGSDWCMPTLSQWMELRDMCSWVWTTCNGMNGFEVKGPNNNKIFLPAAGFRIDLNIHKTDSEGYYWSSSRHMPELAWDACFGSDSESLFLLGNYRCYGLSVRPVRSRK